MEQQYYVDIVSGLAERTIKRLWVLVILLILFSGTITYFYVDLLNNLETVEVTQEVETGEGNAYVAGVGDVNYGESEADGQSDSP